MIRSSFPRYLTLIICVFCAICLVDAIIAVMRGDTAIVLASQKKGLAQGPQEPFMVKDINPGGDSNPQLLTNFANSLFFTVAYSDTIGLWRSDGTITGTVLISEVVPGGWPVKYQNIIQFKNRLYLDSGYRIWTSDGSPEGTTPLIPVLYRAIEGMITTSDRLTFFTTDEGCTRICWDNGLEMWTSDGTISGTVNHGFITGGSFGYNPYDLAHIDEIIYFSAYYSDQGDELWRSDGTLEGTHLVKDIFPGYNQGSNPYQFSVVNDTLFFVGNLHELWKSDGTITGTVRVKVIVPSGYGEIDELEKVGNKLFISAGDVAIGFGLWVSDGTEDGTQMVKQFDWAEIPSNLTDVGGMLFFTVGGSEYGIELWKSDGTTEGTVLVKDINPGLNSSNPQELTMIGGKLFFSADDGIHGVEPWVSDGTEEGTILLSDIEVGEGSSYPENFVYSHGMLFFSATEVIHGRELWVYDFNLIQRFYLPYIYDEVAGGS